MRPIRKVISDAGKHLGLSAAGQNKHLEDRPARRKPGRPASPYSLRLFSAVLRADEIGEIKAFAAQLQIFTNEAARVIIREGLAIARGGEDRDQDRASSSESRIWLISLIALCFVEVASATRANGLEFSLANTCLLRWNTVAFPQSKSSLS